MTVCVLVCVRGFEVSSVQVLSNLDCIVVRITIGHSLPVALTR